MDEFTALDFATVLADGLLSILPWVGAGVAAGLVLMFAYLGIRKGIGFFKGTTGSYDSDGSWSGPSPSADDLAMIRFYDVESKGEEYTSRFDWASGFGIDDKDAHDYAAGRAVDTLDVNGDRFISNARD